MKRTILIGLCLALLLCACIQPGRVHALTPLEPDHICSLTLHYTQDGLGFEGLSVRIYRVAEAFPDGTFELVAPFSGYPVNIHGITSQKEWQDVASTLKAYVAADQVEPTAVATTDETGTAVWENLQTGLYFVHGVIAEKESGTYQFNDFMVYLPTPLEGEGFDYDVEAVPKCTQFIPNTHFSLVKLWKDAGNEQDRPKSVTVDILKDGQLHETVVLSQENNWSYNWTVPEGTEVWTVVERDVPAGYTVSISENGYAFVITNTKTNPVDPPVTGDVFPLWLLTSSLCISGFAIVLLSTWRERKRT